MIKINKEIVSIKGTTTDLLAEFGYVSKILMDNIGMETVSEVFSFACADHIKEKESD